MPQPTAVRARRPPGLRLIAHDRRMGVRTLAGADEAGRGCLAGPLVAAAVAFDVDRLRGRRSAALRMLDDSKRHQPEAREQLYGAIVATAMQIAVCVIPAPSLDTRGLHRSNLDALRRVLLAIDPAPELSLTDGFELAGFPRPHRRLIGGDGRSAAIAAASIVAKVTRDRYMHRIAPEYPDFGFEQHVGYITPAHTQAVRRHGVTPLHRRSFHAIAYQLVLE